MGFYIGTNGYYVGDREGNDLVVQERPSIFHKWVDGEWISIPTVKEMEDAVQSHLDATASKAGYDNIYTACTYAEEPAVPKFENEGKALRAWRSLVWAYCHQVLADVEGGKRPVPTISGLIGELPASPL